MAFKVIQSGGEILVNTTTENTQYEPSITALADGGWVVFWRDSHKDGDRRGIFMQRYAADGSAIGEETQVNTSVAGQQEAPRATALADGGWVVTWMSDHDRDGNYQVYQQRYAADGQKVGDETLVSGSLTGSQDYPVVTALEGGGWVVTWLSGTSTDTTIYQQRFNSEGEPATEAPVAIEATAGPGLHITVATTALPDGGWVATWTGGGVMGGSIHQQRFNADGTAHGDASVITSAPPQFPNNSAITTLADGGWVVTWAVMESGAGVTWVIKQQRFLADGTALPIETVNSTGPGGHVNAEVQALPDGGWVVTWTASGFDGSDYAVLQQRFDANGNRVGEETIVNTTTAGRQYSPAIAVLEDGSWVIAWWSSLNQNGTDADIYQQRIYSTIPETMTAGVDQALGTEDDDILKVTPGSLSAGDTLEAGEGTDTLQMIEAGELDLTAPDIFTGFEIVEGSDGDDIIIANDDRIQGLTIQGGDGIDTLRMATAGAFDLAATELEGIEVIEGTDGDDIIIANGDQLAGIAIEGGDGDDTLRMAMAGILDLNGTEFNSIEGIEGSDGDDIIVANNDRLEVLQSIDGRGGTNILRLAGSDAFDLTALTVANISKIVLTEETGALVTVSDQATALLLHAEASDNDRIILSGDTFSLTQRRQLFRQGFETVTDDGGTYTNAAPTGITLDNTSVNELAASGTRVGVLSAEDPDEEEEFTFELLDDAGGRFMISGNEILVKNGLALDFEQASSHTIRVRVIDGGGKFVDREMTISVNDINPEIATGTAGADRLVGGNGNDRSSGLQGNDTLTGGNGHDSLNGGDGRDSLSGGNGNDTLFGGAGKDTLIGGAGNDTYLADATDVIIETAGGGTDTILTDGSFSLASFAQVENLKTRQTSAKTTLALTGNAKDNIIVGNAGKNQLNGGAGNDTLTGGAGKDQFIFTAKVDKKSWKANVDKITDYKPKDDTILLDNAVFKKLGKKGSLKNPAKLNKDFFTVGSKAKDKNDYLIFDPKKKVLLYDADGSGKGAAYAIVTFDKKLKLTMTAAEFLVI